MNILPEDFVLLTSLLARAAGCPLTLVLEGGYGPSHGAAVASVFQALKDPVEPFPACTPRPQTLQTVDLLRKVHRLSG